MSSHTRKVVALSTTIEDLQYLRKANEQDDDLGPLEAYHTAGKKAAVLLDPFGAPMQAFMVGPHHKSDSDVFVTIIF